jgi:hypothetical protein
MTGTLVVRGRRTDGTSFVCIIADNCTPSEMQMIQFGFLWDGTAVHPEQHEILAYYPGIDPWTVGLNTPEDHPMWQET